MVPLWSNAKCTAKIAVQVCWSPVPLRPSASYHIDYELFSALRCFFFLISTPSFWISEIDRLPSRWLPSYQTDILNWKQPAGLFQGLQLIVRVMLGCGELPTCFFIWWFISAQPVILGNTFCNRHWTASLTREEYFYLNIHLCFFFHIFMNLLFTFTS